MIKFRKIAPNCAKTGGRAARAGGCSGPGGGAPRALALLVGNLRVGALEDHLQGYLLDRVGRRGMDVPAELAEELELELALEALLLRPVRAAERDVHPLVQLRRDGEADLGYEVDLVAVDGGDLEVAEQHDGRERDEALGAVGEVRLQRVDDVEHPVDRLRVHPPLEPGVAPARQSEREICRARGIGASARGRAVLELFWAGPRGCGRCAQRRRPQKGNSSQALIGLGHRRAPPSMISSALRSFASSAVSSETEHASPARHASSDAIVAAPYRPTAGRLAPALRV